MPWATVRAIGTVRAAIAHGAGATILARTGVGISGARVAAQHRRRWWRRWWRRRSRRWWGRRWRRWWRRRHGPRSTVEAVGAQGTLFIRYGSRTSIFAYSVAHIVLIKVHVSILSVVAVIRAKHPWRYRRRTWKRGGRGWRRRRRRRAWHGRRRRRRRWRRRNVPWTAVDAIGAKRTLVVRVVVVLGAWPSVVTDASTA